MPTGLPRCPGHEIVGTVAAIGPDEKRWKVGERVGSGWHGGHCMICRSCLKGDFVTCSAQNINGIVTDGGYSEYCTLRSEALLSIPEDIDPAEAAVSSSSARIIVPRLLIPPLTHSSRSLYFVPELRRSTRSATWSAAPLLIP